MVKGPSPSAGILVALGLLLLLALGGALLVGASAIGPSEVLALLRGEGDEMSHRILLQLRLPRALLAILVGGALAVAGTVLQALLRNPLAEPYILGLSGGAALGAVLVIGSGLVLLAPALMPIAAFGGALGTTALVLMITRTAGPALDPRVFILTGVVVGAFFNALVLLVLSFSDLDTLRSAFFWMMGSLAGASWEAIGTVLLYFLPPLLLLARIARPLDLLTLGEESAGYLGARVDRIRRVAYWTASLLVAASVAVSGIIGFVGLVVPHALRLLGGSGHRYLLPASFLAGGLFLLGADTIARTIVAPAELPVGVVSALIGVPLFLLLLVRSGR